MAGAVGLPGESAAWWDCAAVAEMPENLIPILTGLAAGGVVPVVLVAVTRISRRK